MENTTAISQFMSQKSLLLILTLNLPLDNICRMKYIALQGVGTLYYVHTIHT